MIVAVLHLFLHLVRADWAPYVSSALLQQIHVCNVSVVTSVDTPTPGGAYIIARRARPVQIIDIAPLLDEIELLEIRLYELRDIVDWFIVIEQNETHTGLAKEVVYHKHIGRLTKLLGQHVMRKIIYYNCAYPAEFKIEKVVLGSSPQQALHWRRENYMRSGCARTIVEEMRQKLQPGALLMMSDMDEIPDAFGVASLKYCHYTQPAAPDNNEARLVFFGQVRYHFNFHCASSNMYHWTGTMLTTVEHGLAMGLQLLRDKRQQAPVGADLRIPHGFGGWHFSNSPFGDARKLVNKYRSFTETQTLDHLGGRDALDYWSYAMVNGGDVRSNTQCHEFDLRHLPRLVHDLPHKYIDLLSKEQIGRLID